MSLEFIKSGYNRDKCLMAARQEKQLSYFTSSKLQEDNLTEEYLKQWAERKYQSNDYFLNHVKSIFKTPNFLTFFKYLRHPVVSARIINNDVYPALLRVFHAEDSRCEYVVNGVDNSAFIKDMKSDWLNRELFEAYLYEHNSVLITDLDSEEKNKPYRFLICIDEVISISYNEDDTIKAIAFESEIEINGKEEHAITYIDDKTYEVWKDEKLLLTSPHDLGHCPAHFIVNKEFADNSTVKESIFSYVRPLLEEYVFLCTLQRMTEPNGVIPITAKFNAAKKEDKSDIRREQMEPNADNIMSSGMASKFGDNPPSGIGDLQTGTIINVKPPVKADNSLDMAMIENYFKFFYLPIEAINYLNNRIKEIELSIKKSILGDAQESNESSKNEMQIEKSLTGLQNVLRNISADLSRIRTLADFDFLALKYGKDQVITCEYFFGSDFYLSSESELMDMFEKAPNPIERRQLIIKLNRNRFKNSPELANRQTLLYELMPFVADKDFETAINSQLVDDVTKKYQLRFNYWINMFEAKYGSITAFFDSLENSSKFERLTIINNLIIQLINESNPN